MSLFSGISLSPERAALLAGILALFLIGGYTLYAALPLILGPSLTILEPRVGIVSGMVTIAGKTARVDFLEINDKKEPVREDGSFSVERAFPEGYTVVTVSARDRFGRTLIKTISFIQKNPHAQKN